MTDTKIGDVISMLDEKIKELQIARKILIEQFPKDMTEHIEHPSLFAESIPKKGKRRRIIGTSKRGTVAKLIKEHGPLKATEIQEKTGYSRGTIGWILSGNKDTFVPIGEGKWDLTEEAKK